MGNLMGHLVVNVRTVNAEGGNIRFASSEYTLLNFSRGNLFVLVFFRVLQTSLLKCTASVFIPPNLFLLEK